MKVCKLYMHVCHVQDTCNVINVVEILNVLRLLSNKCITCWVIGVNG
jgi:hypothetical protein